MDISETVELKGHEKCIFEAPHNEIKCVLRIKDSKFNLQTPTVSLTEVYPLFLTPSLNFRVEMMF